MFGAIEAESQRSEHTLEVPAQEGRGVQPKARKGPALEQAVLRGRDFLIFLLPEFPPHEAILSRNPGEIEFKDDQGCASGKRLYVQLKSGDSYLKKRRSDGAEVFQIKKLRGDAVKSVGQLAAVPCPERASESSAALQRRVSGSKVWVCPEGTAESKECSQSSLRDENFFSGFSGVETPGYCRMLCESSHNACYVKISIM